MTTPNLDMTPWGFIEWSITALATAVVAVTGFMMKTSNKISNHSVQISNHEEVIDELKDDMKNINDKLSERPTHDDISQFFQTMLITIEGRFDQLNTRLERIDGRIDNILRKTDG